MESHKHTNFNDEKDWIRHQIKLREEEINAFLKVEEHEFSAWDLTEGAKAARKELRERFLLVRPDHGFGKVCGVPVPELGIAILRRGVKYVCPEKILKMFDARDGEVDTEGHVNLDKYADFCETLYSLHRWKYALKFDDFFDSLNNGLDSKKEYNFFAKMIKKNREEKVSFLTDEQYMKYRRVFAELYEQLPSERFDKMPALVGLAMADPLTLMDSVKKHGIQETAAGVAQWFNAEHEKLKDADRKSYVAGLAVRASGAAMAIPTALFAPNLPIMERGFLGFCAALSGLMTFERLQKHKKEMEKLEQQKQLAKPFESPVAVTLAKYAPKER
ncbi:MAG: hypothetical protein II938_04190 [Alphaproteobacteria bacterium]|nr:hypothetical protein [Alphaproteobacteria bacterium]